MRGTLFDGSLDPLEAVHRDVGRQTVQQRLVDHRRAARRMKHENRWLGGAFGPGPNRADEAVDLAGLQEFAHGARELLDGLGRLDVVNGDRALCPLRQPLRHLGGGGVVQLGQVVEDAAR